MNLADTPAGEVPMALAELHRSLAVGTTTEVVFGDWSDAEIEDALVGAGFVDPVVSGRRSKRAVAARARTLPDTVATGMRLLVCGLNPSLHAADAGVGFVSPSNRFWPAAIAAGVASVARDTHHALRHHGTGMTDLVKRATTRADELTRDEYEDGLARVARLCRRLEPAAVCMVGLAGWRAAVDRRATTGWQDAPLGGRPVYVMPSTSGLNAHSRLDDLVAHLRRAAGAPP